MMTMAKRKVYAREGVLRQIEKMRTRVDYDSSTTRLLEYRRVLCTYALGIVRSSPLDTPVVEVLSFWEGEEQVRVVAGILCSLNSRVRAHAIPLRAVG
jgi:hypothetical protein